MNDRWLTPLMGIVSVLLFVISVFVIESGHTPGEDATGADVAAYYEGNISNAAVTSVLCAPVDAETLLAFVASSYGVVMAVSPMLQIRAILRSRDSSSVSAGYQRVLLFGFLLWLAYGVASDNWAIIVPNIVAAFVALATIFVTKRYRPRA